MAAGDRNRGSILLARTGLSQEAIATSLGGVSRVSVAHWMSGATKPNAERREQLWKLYGIPVTAWDEPAEMAKLEPAEPKPAGARYAVPESVLGKASVLEQMAHDLLVDLQVNEKSTPLEKARVMASVASTLHLLAKLTGQLELGEKLLQLPQWRTVAKAIEEVLKRHPGALEDFENVMRELDEQLRGAA
jgi:hypothetical protein